MTHLKRNSCFKLATKYGWVLWLENKFCSETQLLEKLYRTNTDRRAGFLHADFPQYTHPMLKAEGFIHVQQCMWDRTVGLREGNLTTYSLELSWRENLCLWEQTGFWLFILNEMKSIWHQLRIKLVGTFSHFLE